MHLALFLVTVEIVSLTLKAYVVVEVELHSFLTSTLGAGE
jgi:hypothetical protein